MTIFLHPLSTLLLFGLPASLLTEAANDREGANNPFYLFHPFVTTRRGETSGKGGDGKSSAKNGAKNGDDDVIDADFKEV